MKKVICLMAGLLLMTSCYKKGTREEVPMRIVNTNRYTYYERTLDTIQVDSNTYQVNAIYSGCKLMSVVRVCTFNK